MSIVFYKKKNKQTLRFTYLPPAGLVTFFYIKWYNLRFGLNLIVSEGSGMIVLP